MTALAGPAQALQTGFAPWLVCANNKEAAEVAARNMPLEPTNGATVPAGTAATFSGESDQALTFSVASSSALLVSPDVDSGPGSQSGAFYRFTSTKATAAPRTIYWQASFTFTPEDCESPSTFTTPLRTFTVVPTEAELAPAKTAQEAEAAKKRLENQATATKEREAREAAERLAKHPSSPALCVVPRLKGDSLATARNALSKAHCKLGKVSKSPGHHKPLLVTAQGPKTGKTLPNGAPIAVTLGASKAKR